MSNREMRPEEEARSLIHGDRNDSYGAWSVEAERIAACWSAICQAKIEPGHVALMMTAMKIIRHTHKPKRDNIVDAIGYLLLEDER